MKCYDDYINNIIKYLKEDLIKFFPKINLEGYNTIFDMLAATNEKFIFLIDEWDYILTHNLFKKHHKSFLYFLLNLFKDKSYVALCYITGILPIKKYYNNTLLNFFNDYTFLNDRLYAEYFGFTKEEISELCMNNKEIKYEDLKKWYNGYISVTGLDLFNPSSVVTALRNNYCDDYWTKTEATKELIYYIENNIVNIRNSVTKMLAGIPINIVVTEEYVAEHKNTKNTNEMYCELIAYGFLTYYKNTIKIPNIELIRVFKRVISSK